MVVQELHFTASSLFGSGKSEKVSLMYCAGERWERGRERKVVARFVYGFNVCGDHTLVVVHD